MKKGNGIIYFALLLIASLLAELYCLLQFRNDYITVAGVGIIALIAAYLVMDGIKALLGSYISSRNEMQDTLLKQLDERMQESDKLQKALYVAVKKVVPAIEAERKQLAELKSQLSQNQLTAAKLVVKYSREDSQRLEELEKDLQKDLQQELLHIGTLIEQWKSDESINDMKKEVSDGFQSTGNCLNDLKAALESLERAMAASNLQLREEVPAGEQISGMGSETQQEPEGEAAVEAEAVPETMPEGETAVEPEAEPEAEPVAGTAPMPNIDLSDPNKAMSPDEIAALFASAGGASGSDAVAAESEQASESEVSEPTPMQDIDLSDPNKAMSPDEIAALFASASGASGNDSEAAGEVASAEPEPAPMPDIDLSDPNKAMSPDEIAALFASVGGTSGSDAASAESEQASEPAPELDIDLSDPNKAMSPDDIAALFASMGN